MRAPLADRPAPIGSRRVTEPERRLRIAFVYDGLVPFTAGGGERRYHELATRLAERHEVHHVSWRFWGPEASVVRDGVVYHGVGFPRQFYGQDGKRTIRGAAEFALRIIPLLARLRVDVVDASATPYLPLYGAWLATRASRTPLVATWHEFWGRHWATYLPDRPLVARFARLVEAGARPLGDRRVAVSAFTARRLAGREDVSGSRTTAVVGNGVDVAAIQAAEPDPERFDVLHVGRLIDEKRVDLLVRAVAAAAGDVPGIRCGIVGDGPEAVSLRALAGSLGIADRVTFLGRVPAERVPRLLRSARVLALPSAREGYGIVVVEGQAAGAVPIVARSPFSAAPDLVTDGVDGLVADPTVDGFAAALTRLLADDVRREGLAAAARIAARRRSWDERVAEMERLYQAVASRREPRARRRQVAPVIGEADC